MLLDSHRHENGLTVDSGEIRPQPEPRSDSSATWPFATLSLRSRCPRSGGRRFAHSKHCLECLPRGVAAFASCILAARCNGCRLWRAERRRLVRGGRRQGVRPLRVPGYSSSTTDLCLTPPADESRCSSPRRRSPGICRLAPQGDWGLREARPLGSCSC